jgi:hypothetical protein
MNVTKEFFMELLNVTSAPQNKRLITFIQELKNEKDF